MGRASSGTQQKWSCLTTEPGHAPNEVAVRARLAKKMFDGWRSGWYDPEIDYTGTLCGRPEPIFLVWKLQECPGVLEVSSRLGPYEIVAPLGAGGMGEVYRARDTRLGREVAVKVLPAPFANDPDRRARFEREVRAVAALSHPNILAIHDYGTHADTTYAVMELLEGETLRSRLAKGPLSWREAVEIGAAIAQGLAAAHAKGIVHRDLKPENLFLTADGRVKILDFGLARMEVPPDAQMETGPYVPAATSPGVVMGTAGYMSPEQVRSQPVDARSDIFSFGCVLYEMVTGRRAFQRETSAETMTAILHDEPPEPPASGHVVPAELGRIIRQCLAKNPNQRLQSARDLALGLRTTANDPTLHRLPATRRFSWRLVGVPAAVLLAGVIGVSVYLLTRGADRSDVRKPTEEAKTIEALAVLPFENVAGDPEAEYLSDGIPESIIKSLYEVRSLKVRPFSSISRYKGRGKELDLQELGRQLNVQAVLTGKLTLRKDRLSLSVELVDVRDLSGLWSDQFDRQRTDIQAVQDEITQQICAKLGIQLTGEEQKRLIKHYTENTEAYNLYLKGRLQLKKIRVGAIKKGIEYFEEAVGTDPRYALAYTGLADSYSTLAQWGYLPAREASPKARKAAEEALKIDATLSEAHTSLAYIKMNFDWDWPAAETEFRRAIALDAKNAVAHHWYSHYLTAMGRTEESLAASKRALELDPLNENFMVHLGWHFCYARQYDDALEQLRKAIDMAPKHGTAHAFHALACVQKGRHAEAIDEAKQATLLAPEWSATTATLGYAYAVSGKRDRALTVLDELTALSGWKDVSYYKASIYTGLGQKQQALEWLEKAYDEHSDLLVYVKVDPIFESLSKEPRFDKLLQRMGLADKAAARDQGIQSIAVLPFQNVGGDPKTEFLSDGVADQIINSLSQVRRHDLKIRPFTSVSRYKGKEPDIPTFGRELNVQMIVTGTLRQQGDDLTISVALVDVREDNNLWSDTYRGKLGAILDLQDQIARDVAARLQLRLTGEEEKRLTKRHTSDTEAYLLYRKGRHAWTIRTDERLKQSISYFKQAIDKDPNFALAYAGLADSYSSLGYWGGLPPKDAFPKARKAAEQALAIDNTLAEAHTALGYIKLHFDWDWPAAEAAFKRAIELDPNHASACHWYSHCLIVMGRSEESLTASKRALELDPLDRNITLHLAWHYYYVRDYDRAIAHLRSVRELEQPFHFAHYFLAMALLASGGSEPADVRRSRYAEAVAEAQAATVGGQERPAMIALLGYAHGMSGNKPEARKVLGQLTELSKRRYISPYDLAMVHVGLGEKDQAVQELRRAYEERSPHLVLLKAEPIFDSLRSDPRFTQLLKDMRLPP